MRFSPMITMTCLIGVVVLPSFVFLLAGWALAANGARALTVNAQSAAPQNRLYRQHVRKRAAEFGFASLDPRLKIALETRGR